MLHREKAHSIFWVEHLNRRNHSDDPGVDERIMLKWMLGKQVGNMWTSGLG